MVVSLNVKESVSRLQRTQQQIDDRIPARVITPGTAPQAWLVRIDGPPDRNRYPVRLVEIIGTGTNPVVAGGVMQAYNVAESFTQAGVLTAGLYAVMWRIGQNYVIQVSP